MAIVVTPRFQTNEPNFDAGDVSEPSWSPPAYEPIQDNSFDGYNNDGFEPAEPAVIYNPGPVQEPISNYEPDDGVVVDYNDIVAREPNDPTVDFTFEPIQTSEPIQPEPIIGTWQPYEPEPTFSTWEPAPIDVAPVATQNPVVGSQAPQQPVAQTRPAAPAAPVAAPAPPAAPAPATPAPTAPVATAPADTDEAAEPAADAPAVTGSTATTTASSMAPNSATRQASDSRILEILNNPALSFEDMVAMVMFEVVRQHQDEIADRLRAFQAGEAKPADGSTGETKPNEGDASGAAAPAAAPQQGGGIFDFIVKAVTGLVTTALMGLPPVGPMLAPLVAAVIPKIIGAAMPGAPPPASDDSAEATGTAADDGAVENNDAATDDQASLESRSRQFELLKLDMQRLSEMQTVLSNILSMLHDTAKSAIDKIR
jgi:hypothetical protein